MRTIEAKKNRPNWTPSERDFVLVFIPSEDGIWRERTNNIQKYFNMTLADFLSALGVFIPDYCQFCRIISDEMYFEYRAYNGARVRIDVTYND